MRKVYHTSIPLLSGILLFDIKLTDCKEHSHGGSPGSADAVKMKDGQEISSGGGLLLTGFTSSNILMSHPQKNILLSGSCYEA